MDANTIKDHLHQLIDKTDDEQLLTELYEKMKHASKNSDWWDELSDNQKHRLMESESQYRHGKVVSNEEVLKKIQESLKK